MNAKLVTTFLSEDCDAETRRQLVKAIRSAAASGCTAVREYTFNRFKLSLDFGAQEARLEDDLTVGPDGEFKLSMDDLERALSQ